MLLWILFAVMTAATLAAVLAPLVRPARQEAGADAGTLNVYRDQLEEIDADRARGLIEPGEAEAARIEISRRLLARADGPKPAAPQAVAPNAKSAAAPPRFSMQAVAIAAAVLVPLLTLGLYLTQGVPGLPSAPYSARTIAPLQTAALDDLVARVEARLREHPEDGEGWDAIAPVYFKVGRYRDAANAYSSAARLKGESVRRLGGFAESSIFAADGIVTETARRAYERILELEPGRVEARFWLGLANEQDGKFREAIANYKALLKDAPADAAWRGNIERRIADAELRLAGAAPAQLGPGVKPAPRTAGAEPGKPGPSKEPAPRGPSAEDIAAAQNLSPADRNRMIAQMVDGLAERLARDGRDLAGWQRLVRAYVVLDRKDDARTALAKARKTFATDKRAIAELSDLATTLGLGS